MKLEEIVPTDKLNEIFELNSTAFGNIKNKNQVLAIGLLKISCGYTSGRTVNLTLEHFGLIYKYKDVCKLTKKGKLFLYYYYETK